MKKRFSEAQSIGFLREAEAGLPVKQVCRRHGFSGASYYLWRNQFGGMTVSDAKGWLSTREGCGLPNTELNFGTTSTAIAILTARSIARRITPYA